MSRPQWTRRETEDEGLETNICIKLIEMNVSIVFHQWHRPGTTKENEQPQAQQQQEPEDGKAADQKLLPANNAVLPSISMRSSTRLWRFAGRSRSPEPRCTDISRLGKPAIILNAALCSLFHCLIQNIRRRALLIWPCRYLKVSIALDTPPGNSD
jgi:hypothetical protein